MSRLPFERYCGRDQRSHRAQQQGETLAAQFACDRGRLHNQQRRRQRWNESNAAERVAEHRATDAHEKRYEGRLVDITPGKVIAAGHVVEFVAEISVTIIEIDVEEQIGDGDGPNRSHASGKERLLVAAGRRRRCSGSHGRGLESCRFGEPRSDIRKKLRQSSIQRKVAPHLYQKAFEVATAPTLHRRELKGG